MAPLLIGALIVGLAALVPAKPKAEENALSAEIVKTWKTGRMILVVGASQSGKTHYVTNEIKAARRLLIWDVEEQYCQEPGMLAIRSMKALGRYLQRNPRHFRVCYIPNSLGEFEDFCRWAFFALECSYLHAENGERPATYIVAEEISDVTNPGKAPPAWGQLIRRGLKRNMWLFGVTQSPKESDKTFVRNCSEAHVCGVQGLEEPAYLALKLNVPESHIAGLNRDKKQFLHKNLISGVVTYGGLVRPDFATGSPAPAAPVKKRTRKAIPAVLPVAAPAAEPLQSQGELISGL